MSLMVTLVLAFKGRWKFRYRGSLHGGKSFNIWVQTLTGDQMSTAAPDRCPLPFLTSAGGDISGHTGGRSPKVVTDPSCFL